MAEEQESRALMERLTQEMRNKLEEDEDLAEEAEDFDRDIMVEFDNDERFNFSLKNGGLSEVQEGPLDDADIVLSTDTDTLEGLLDGDISPMEAYARKKVKIDASFTDLLKIKNLL